MGLFWDGQDDVDACQVRAGGGWVIAGWVEGNWFGFSALPSFIWTSHDPQKLSLYAIQFSFPLHAFVYVCTSFHALRFHVPFFFNSLFFRVFMCPRCYFTTFLSVVCCCCRSNPIFISTLSGWAWFGLSFFLKKLWLCSPFMPSVLHMPYIHANSMISSYNYYTPTHSRPTWSEWEQLDWLCETKNSDTQDQDRSTSVERLNLKKKNRQRFFTMIEGIFFDRITFQFVRKRGRGKFLDRTKKKKKSPLPTHLCRTPWIGRTTTTKRSPKKKDKTRSF
jgi:hypothetical protein